MGNLLKRRDETPPDGFRFFCPETNTWIKAVNYPEWIGKIRAHYTANSIPIPPNIEQRAEEELCTVLPPGTCQNPPKWNGRLNITSILAGTRVLATWLVGGMQKVEPAEAESRALICARCELNMPYEGCTSCAQGAMLNTINAIVNGAKTPYDSQLQGCAACSCSLRAKVWLPLDLLQKNTSEDINNKLPDHCWLKRK